MSKLRTMTLATLCGAVLMLWGCPAEESEVTEERPAVDAHHDHGEHVDGEHAHDYGEHRHDHGVTDTSAESPSGAVRNGTRVVEVEAKRYEFVPATIVVRKGEPVRLEITATDVMHGLAVEGMEIDVRLPPNQTQTVEFTPEEAGEYHIHCSVYCGPGHDEMHGTLLVTE